MLSVVGHDLSGVQDNDDGREGSVDDSDSEKGMVSTGVTAGWVRAQGPKEPSLHARPLKSALKKSNTSAPTSTNSPSPLPTPTQDHQHGGVAWQEPPPPPRSVVQYYLIRMTNVFETFHSWIFTEILIPYYHIYYHALSAV